MVKMNTFRVRFEDFTAATVKSADFLGVTLCGSCKNQRFGGRWGSITSHIALFVVTANVVPSSPILVTLIMKALRSSET
jgi:hypothetical protein